MVVFVAGCVGGCAQGGRVLSNLLRRAAFILVLLTS